MRRTVPPLAYDGRRDVVCSLAFYAAITIIPFTRARVGTRVVARKAMALICAGFVLIPYFGTGHFSVPFTLYGIALAMAAFIHSSRHRKAIARGGVTYPPSSFGDSYFTALPIPAHLAYYVCDPAVGIIIGYCFTFFNQPLGYWIFLSGISIGLEELQIKRRADRALLDDLDTLHLAQQHLKNVERQLDQGDDTERSPPLRTR